MRLAKRARYTVLRRESHSKYHLYSVALCPFQQEMQLAKESVEQNEKLRGNHVVAHTLD